jgi:hypothetical protein
MDKDIILPKIQKSPHPFLKHYVKTIDPHDEDGLAKDFPYSRPYVQRLVDGWLENRLMLVAKSRQMIISWLFVALYTWDAMVHDGKFIFFQSRKEDDAGLGSPLSLLSRALFIWQNLPDWMQEEFPITTKRKPQLIVFEKTKSTIYAVSQDSDALRQYTATGIFADELAFQEDARDAFIASKPTIDGGSARYTGVSTANGKNFFYELFKDLDAGEA